MSRPPPSADPTAAAPERDGGSGRREAEQFLRALIDPLVPHLTPGCAGVRLGPTLACYGERRGLLEGYARPLWGLAPAAAGGVADLPCALWREGLVNGTNPEHPEYWGRCGDLDQRMVEASIIALSLWLAPDHFWNPLPGTTRDRVIAWLRAVLAAEPVDNNWRFFRVLVNAVLRHLGAEWSPQKLATDFARLDSFYLGDGWYRDGGIRHCDYYVPMAMHLYGLIYAKLARDVDPERAGVLTQRAREFAPGFARWFAADGGAVPFGRSLTYRCAAGAFWGALAFAGVEALPWSEIKGLYLRHLRWWSRQPVRTETGLLTLGYQYPNLAMTEKYNGPASPYWACKAFLPLAVPPSHPFWSDAEMPATAGATIATVPVARHVVVADEGRRHVILLNPGHEMESADRHRAAKYSKFAYSSHFAFSVPLGGDSLGEGGFDSMLALSDDGMRFRARDRCCDIAVRNGTAASRWYPWPDVEIRTWLIAAPDWHLRVHRMVSGRELWSAEAGFATGYTELEELRIDSGPDTIVVCTASGGSGLVGLLGQRSPESVPLEPNSNLAHPLAAMPVLRGRHPAGPTWLVCAAFGWPVTAKALDPQALLRSLTVSTSAECLDIRLGGTTIWTSAEPVSNP